jgi:inosose dehydratase
MPTEPNSEQRETLEQRGESINPIGCQTYTWEMVGARWEGRVDDILAAIADSGYDGIEITKTMIREYRYRPADFSTALKEHRLVLAAFAYGSPLGFTEPGNRELELNGADEALQFVANFPGTPLMLGGPTTSRREGVFEKIARAADFYNEVGRRATKVGVEVAFHPHSHHGSILESREEYERIMELTDPALISWNPDTGHIVRGGQNLAETLRRFGARIRHLHLKDVDSAKQWQPLGRGVCDIPAILQLLTKELKFTGWIVAEEESAPAAVDPAGAVAGNRRYLKSIGY